MIEKLESNPLFTFWLGLVSGVTLGVFIGGIFL